MTVCVYVYLLGFMPEYYLGGVRLERKCVLVVNTCFKLALCPLYCLLPAWQ